MSARSSAVTGTAPGRNEPVQITLIPAGECIWGHFPYLSLSKRGGSSATAHHACGQVKRKTKISVVPDIFIETANIRQPAPSPSGFRRC